MKYTLLQINFRSSYLHIKWFIRCVNFKQEIYEIYKTMKYLSWSTNFYLDVLYC